MILLLEFFQPARTIRLEMTLGVPNSLSEEAGLLSNNGI
jgi:hypothetical protein